MADDSIAVVDLERCQPDRCSYECANFCPPNRTGKECIITREERFEEDEPYAGRPEQISISEEICLGETCGICVEKCPFDAIEIINLPQELEDDPAHRFGENAFALYGLPAPAEGNVVGILGPNGIGETTAVRILGGQLEPNLGNWADPPDAEDAIRAFRGTAIQEYLESVREGDVTVARKPQYVDRIPDQFEGTTADLLADTDERGVLSTLTERLQIDRVLEQPIEALSGGELQRVALCATLARDADFYFFDEITPYLDVGQRMVAAQLIRELADDGERSMLVVEHDLAILDLLCDTLHIGYGEPGAFGVITDPKSVRNGINEYLAGFLENENMRIRQSAIEFASHAPRSTVEREAMVSYPEMTKTYGDDGFTLSVAAGEINRNEVLGVVGPNGIGKSTFAKLLAGEETPDDGSVEIDLSISYKPQYIEIDQAMRVDTFLATLTDDFDTSYWNTEIANPLSLPRLYDLSLPDLSGGERQRVAIAACLSREADLYLLDEPSAHLDVEQRVRATETIRRYAENHDATAMVIDHDVYMIDLLADRLLVFDGEPAKHGVADQPLSMRDGMNRFLADLDVTFRRDERTARPRINKPGSRLDREQKRQGEHYYAH